MHDKETIRFAVIGLGHIGKRHRALVEAHPEATAVASCDPVKQEADFRDLNTLLTSGPAFDVGCVCTPNGLHADQAIRLLETGHDAVVEKPLALTVGDCNRMLVAAARSGQTIFGVMQNRYSPAAAWLKEVVTVEALGEVLQVHVDCFWNRDERYYTLPGGRSHPWHGHPELDGGVLFTQFAHFVDLLCWTFGQPDILSSQLFNQTHQSIHDFPDSGSATFRIGEAFGSINFSTSIWDKNFESTLTVIGSKGTIKLGGQYMNELRYCHVAGLETPVLPPSNPANNYGPYTGSAANHHFVIDNVIDFRRGRAKVATTAEEGRAVVAVIEAIYAAGGERR